MEKNVKIIAAFKDITDAEFWPILVVWQLQFFLQFDNLQRDKKSRNWHWKKKHITN